ncbi:MAG: SdiA-regulated domain-containing protein [Bacteroidales bacterium]|nr:SdiA-regulated domain-containing protein [Bacteroidales bacterium]
MSWFNDYNYFGVSRQFGMLLMVFIPAILLLNACTPEPAPLTINEINNFPYKLSRPDKGFELPAELEEISGLAFDDINNRLIAVQDELGILFFINPDSGSVIEKVKFGKPGDYEGIAWVNDTVFVVRSDGRIYSVANYDKPSISTTTFKTPLSAKNDVEGLAYDATKRKLLLLNKRDPSLKKKNQFKGKRAVYEFDLGSKTLTDEPALLIDIEQLKAAIEKEYFTKLATRIGRFLRLYDEVSDFMPSAIAIHPITKDHYILAHIGKLLVVYDSSYQLKYIKKLDPTLFRQPEGMAFSENADLFIANEARGGRAKLLRFNFVSAMHLAEDENNK